MTNHRPKEESWLEKTTRSVRNLRRIRREANDALGVLNELSKSAVEANVLVSKEDNDAVDVAILTHLALISAQLSFLVMAAHRQFDQSLISMHEDSVPRTPEEESLWKWGG